MIALYGHGYVASAIARAMWRRDMHFQMFHHDQALPDIRYSVIINAAGYVGTPNVDACEDDKAGCFEGNVLWPVYLEQQARGVPVIHIGSGCVYSGGFNQPFTEDDEPNFDGSFYSKCKAMSQQSLRPYLNKSYLLRIRMPFGPRPHPRNLLDKIAGYPKLVNFSNSITSIENAAECVAFFARSRPEPGIYNVVNPGLISNHDIAQEMGLEREWFADEVQFGKTVKAGRSTCALDDTKLSKIFQMRDVVTELQQCCTAWLKQSHTLEAV